VVETRLSRDVDRGANRKKINQANRGKTIRPKAPPRVMERNPTDRRRKSVAVAVVAEAVVVVVVVERIHLPPTHRNRAVSKDLTNPCRRCVSGEM
jgi:hypothetical protein